MRRLEQPNWAYFAAVLPVAVFGLGLIFMNHQEAGIWLTLLGLTLVAFSLRPTFESIHSGWRRQRASAKMKAARAANAQLQQRFLLSWNPFDRAADEFLTQWRLWRYVQSPDNWEAVKAAANAAFSLAHDLEAPDRDSARADLRHFVQIQKEEFDSSIHANHFQKWLYRRREEIRQLTPGPPPVGPP